MKSEDQRRSEAELTYGHPLQYAYCGESYVGHTEDMTDDDVRDFIAEVEHRSFYGLPVERYSRCPTCEQWSPCDVRRAEEVAQ
jgi:hypothetical protein